MNWEALGAIGELLGSIILIASIFYLSRQIRSSTNQATASAESEVQQSFTSIQDSLLCDERTIGTMRKGFASFVSLKDGDKYFFHMKMSLFVNHFEGVLRMAEKGLISQDMVRTQGNIVLTLLGSPGGREFWKAAGGTFQDLSTEYIENNLESGGDWRSLSELFPYFLENENAADA